MIAVSLDLFPPREDEVANIVNEACTPAYRSGACRRGLSSVYSVSKIDPLRTCCEEGSVMETKVEA